jgi:hypothetical protein
MVVAARGSLSRTFVLTTPLAFAFGTRDGVRLSGFLRDGACMMARRCVCAPPRARTAANAWPRKSGVLLGWRYRGALRRRGAETHESRIYLPWRCSTCRCGGARSVWHRQLGFGVAACSRAPHGYAKLGPVRSCCHDRNDVWSIGCSAPVAPCIDGHPLGFQMMREVWGVQGADCAHAE